MPARHSHPISWNDTKRFRPKRKPPSRAIPPPAALIPLPKLDRTLATLLYADTGLSNRLLARAGLWISHALPRTRGTRPGPWVDSTRPERIGVELEAWLQGMCDEIRSESFGKSGPLIDIGKSISSHSCGLIVMYPIDCNAIFCEALPAIGRADKRLEAVVIAALQTLTWVRPYYTYDDQIEHCQDLYEQYLHEVDPGSEDEAYLQEQLRWLQNGIPPEYRFLFRKESKPTFPEFPPPPPQDSWLYGWRLWAEEVRKISAGWTRPIREEAPAGDYFDENFYPEYLTPLLWSTSDPLVEAFDQEAQGFYENCLGSKSVFPLKNGRQVCEVLTDLQYLGECYRLHLKASALKRPLEAERGESA